MDAFTEPNIRRIAVKSAAQVGKSEVLLNVVGRYAMLDPANIMIIQPTLADAEDFSKARLSRMIADTRVLTPLFYEKLKTRDANQTILSKFYKGGRIILVGANSPTGLASRPIRILLCDEVDRYPPALSEGDPVDLAEKRTSNFFSAKIGLFSTPTVKDASRIDVEYLLGTQEEWRHRCPNCGEWHVLSYQDMICDSSTRLDEAGRRAVIVKQVKWRCPDCGFDFDEQIMRRAPQKYFALNPDALQNGVRSFYINGFVSPWLNWRGIMREWLEAQGDPAREAVVMNTRFGISYEQRGEYSDESVFMNRREDYTLPAEVLLITAGVDVQANRLEYLIAGWGVDFECWCLERGLVRGSPTDAATWQALDLILDKTIGNKKIARTFVDSGYSTAFVYEYCKNRRDRYAIKGMGGYGRPLIYKYTYPDAGIILTILGVDDGKNEIYNRLSVTEGAGRIHFPLTFDETFFKQLTAERRIIRKSGGMLMPSWEPVAKGARNEALDCLIYSLAAAKSLMGNADPQAFWKSFTQPAQIKRTSKPRQRTVDIW